MIVPIIVTSLVTIGSLLIILRLVDKNFKLKQEFRDKLEKAHKEISRLEHENQIERLKRLKEVTKKSTMN